METVLSPLTGKPAALADSIDAATIIQLYKDMQLDVEAYFKGIEAVRIYKCNETGFRFYYPGSLAANAAFYEELQKVSPNYYPVKWEHYRSLQYVQPGNRVLDIGCGDGGFLELVLNRIPSATVEGLEFNELAIRKATSKGIKVVAENIETFSVSHKEQFDVVTAYQVLEHVTDVKMFLQTAIDCIKPGGKLIIAVPNNYPYLYKTDRLHTLNLPPHHMGLWSEDSLTAIAPLFNISLIECKPEPLENTYHYTDLYLREHGYSKKLFPLIQRFFKYTRKWRKGQGILAVYSKR